MCSPPANRSMRGHLGLAAARLGDRQAGQLVLHRGRHRHGLRSCHSAVDHGRRGGRGRSPAGRGRAGPGRPHAASGASTSSAPSRSAASCRAARSVDGRRVGEHDVEAQGPARARAAPRGSSPGRSPSVSPGCGRRLSTSSRRARGGADRRGEVGDQQVREHAGEPRARAEHDPVGRHDRRHGLGAGRRRLGQQRHAADPAGRRGDGDLAAHGAQRAGSAGPVRRLGLDRRAVRRTSAAPGPARRAAGPTQSRPATGVAEQLPQRDDQQVADGVPVQRARRCANRCWSTSRQVRPHSSSPHSAASAIRRSPGGSTPELASQPAARAAVVGDGHDGGGLVGDLAQRRERGGEPVAAAERDDARKSSGSVVAVPSAVTRAPGRGATTVASTPCVAQPAPPAPRPSPRCGACRRCSRPRSSRSACPRAGSRHR